MPAYAPTLAGTVVETEPKHIQAYSFTGRVTRLDCTADGSGNVTYQTGHWFRGEISRVVVDPTSVTGSAINVKLNDSHGLDLLGGTASAASKTNNSQYAANGAVDHAQVVDEPLWLVAATGHTSDTFTVWIYEL